MRADPRDPAPGVGRRRTDLLHPLLALFVWMWVPAPAGGQAAHPIPAGDGAPCRVQIASAADVEAAIRTRSGYDITAAPNEPRFMAEFLLDLAERHRARRPAGPPILIRQEEFFPALLRVTGLSPEDAPQAFRMAKRYGQRIVADYRTDRVVEEVEGGPEPRQALAVRVSWPDTGGVADSYTYRDTVSEPNLKLRHERVITYRLLDFDSLVVYDEMEGVSGRPTSGALGALFAVLGMTDILESRFTVAGDGTQVTYTRIKKLFTFDAVATVRADGMARKDLPENRPELERLSELAERELEVGYGAEPPPRSNANHCEVTAS